MAKIECKVECLSCSKVWDKKNALMVGKTHHRVYGHTVIWETHMSGVWKSGKPKKQFNALMPDWEERKRDGKEI